MPATPRFASGMLAAPKPRPSSVIDSRSHGPTQHDAHVDLFRGRVLDHVVQRLGRDRIEVLLGLQGQRLGELGLDQDGQSHPALEGRRVRPQGLLQPVTLQAARPKLEDERAHLGQRLALELTQLVELLQGRLPVTRSAIPRCCAW